VIPRGGGGDRGGDVGRRLRGEEERKGEEGADVWARFARERGAAGAQGRAVRGRKGEGAVGWAGELRRARVGKLGHVGSLGHGGVLGRTREGEDGPRVGKRSRPGWVVFGIGLGCHLGSWAGWVLGFFLILFYF